MSGPVHSLPVGYYDALRRLTLETAGVHLGNDHPFIVETRLSDLASRAGYRSLGDMVEELFTLGTPELAMQVVSTLMRRDEPFNADPESLDALVNRVLPKLQAQDHSRPVRVLSFGCGMGQEALSLIFRLVRRNAQTNGTIRDKIRIAVTGADYPSAQMDRARNGHFSHFEVQRGLAARDLVTFFDPDGDGWRVKSNVRNCIDFSPVHLLSRLDHLGVFDCVMFRGSLSSYSGAAKVRVLRGVAGLVRSGGCLVLGTGETLNHINYGFDADPDSGNVFSRRLPALKPVPVDPDLKTPNGRTTFLK